jgi:hypothetical protein
MNLPADNKRLYLILFLPIFVVHIFLSFANNVPIIYNDEAGYIGKARYFTDGYLPFTLGMYSPGFFVDISFYPGYSALLSPLFFLSNNIETVYKIIQIVNSALMSLIPVLVYRFCCHLANDLPRRFHLVTALAIGCYPPFLLHSNIAWAEALFIPLFLFLCLQLCYLSDNPRKPVLWISSTLTFTLLLATHPRAFAVLPVFLIILIIIAINVLNKNWRKYALVGFPLVSIFIIALVLYTITKTGGGYGIYVPMLLLKYFSLPGFVSLLISCNNKLCYISLASLGIVILGIFRSFNIICIRRHYDKVYAVILFSLLSFISVLLLSAMMMSQTDSRADHIIYGRYLEGVVAPIFVLGFIEYFKKGYGVRFVIAICLIIGLSYFSVSRYLESLPMNGINVLGIYIYRLYTDNFRFSIVVSIFSIFIFMIMVIRRVNRLLPITIAGLFFLISSGYIAHNYIARSANSILNSLDLVTPLKKYAASGGKALSFDNSSLNMSTIGHVYVYPVNVPALSILFFNSRKGKSAQSELFINGSLKAPDWARGARLIGLERNFPQYLWLLPGKAQNQFIKEGWVLPVNFPSPLPNDALYASMTLQNHHADIQNGNSVITLSIKHLGNAAFWPNASSLKQIPWSVGIGLRLFRRRDMVITYADVLDLPRSVYPGQTVTIDIPLQFTRFPAIVDEYVLRIDLLQHGVRLFSEVQDSGLTLPLIVTNKQLRIGGYCPFPGKHMEISHYLPTYKTILPQNVLVKENIYRDNNWTNGEGILKKIYYRTQPEDKFLVLETYGFHPLGNNIIKLGLVVAANGINLKFYMYKNKCYYFMLPENLKELTELDIKSNTFVPKEYGINNDMRKLGVAIRSISFREHADD